MHRVTGSLLVPGCTLTCATTVCTCFATHRDGFRPSLTSNGGESQVDAVIFRFLGACVARAPIAAILQQQQQERTPALHKKSVAPNLCATDVTHLRTRVKSNYQLFQRRPCRNAILTCHVGTCGTLILNDYERDETNRRVSLALFLLCFIVDWYRA